MLLVVVLVFVLVLVVVVVDLLVQMRLVGLVVLVDLLDRLLVVVVDVETMASLVGSLDLVDLLGLSMEVMVVPEVCSMVEQLGFQLVVDFLVRLSLVGLVGLLDQLVMVDLVGILNVVDQLDLSMAVMGMMVGLVAVLGLSMVPWVAPMALAQCLAVAVVYNMVELLVYYLLALVFVVGLLRRKVHPTR